MEHGAGRNPSGQQVERRVGRHLADATALGRLVGALTADDGPRPALQGRVGADHLDQRAQDGHVGHPVGCGSHRDPARADRRVHPSHDGSRVQLGGHAPGCTIGCGDPERAEQRTHPTVDLGAVVQGQHGRCLDDGDRVAFGARTGRQGRHGVRQLLDEGAREPDEAVPEARRAPPRERDLGADRARDVPGIGRLARTPQRMGEARLGRRDGALRALELGDEVHPLAVGEITTIEQRDVLTERPHPIAVHPDQPPFPLPQPYRPPPTAHPCPVASERGSP